AIFTLAAPLMDAAEGLVLAVGGWVAGFLGEGLLHDLWLDGIVGGVGGVVIFVPQIAFMFILLSVLDESGYLARGAFLLDRVLGKVGLHGRSFVPLLSSHACAIPGIMSARTIPDARERLATMLVAPFMSCSARLPVYGLLIAAFFASYGALAKGGILLACYLLGIAAAAATAGLAKVFLGRGEATPFILEMPTYQVPQPGQVLRHMWQHTWAFLARAGGIIVAVSILLWALAYFPRLPEPAAAAARSQAAASLAADAGAEERSQAQDRAEGAAQLAHSAAGRIGTLVEPVIAPLGFDWKMGIGLIGAFAAREVFVSTMGVVYGVGDVGDDDTPLRQAMVADRGPGGAAVWTPAVAVSLLVWFVLAMQCMSTVAVMKRETGGWRWPLAQLAYMNLLAWAGAFAAYRLALLVWP
ncbi:MAG: ferrous iron transporter B, partial [Planctomycetes bacterium]|nr:ferrous iron transporter B [Planctomycetota bacterium]